VVEPDTAGVEVDSISDVMPYPSGERDVPMRLAIHVPPQRLIQRSLLAVDEPILQFCEVALEEADLVLLVRGRRVGGRVLHAEVVEDLALIDRCLGLRDQLRAEHIVAVPDGAVVDGDLDALCTAAVCRVLVAGGEVDVVGHGACTVDVVSIQRAISANYGIASSPQRTGIARQCWRTTSRQGKRLRSRCSSGHPRVLWRSRSQSRRAWWSKRTF